MVFMGTHTGSLPDWVEQVENVDNSSMEINTGPTSHWVEAS